jgi:hypothetical protein
VVEEEQAKDSATTDLPDEPVEMYSDVFFQKEMYSDVIQVVEEIKA